MVAKVKAYIPGCGHGPLTDSMQPAVGGTHSPGVLPQCHPVPNYSDVVASWHEACVRTMCFCWLVCWPLLCPDGAVVRRCAVGFQMRWGVNTVRNQHPNRVAVLGRGALRYWECERMQLYTNASLGV